eukprot:TRINITY_DN47625_c0_g1_i1.p1 TRINITY_DN47625_c0_g1~~TRINITY_DN47625_c0_g1_i1.p1  ORF type:complete len:375 (+),score=140.91 TRINITY_DN47625_c0_g1_i1:95-1126(+)
MAARGASKVDPHKGTMIVFNSNPWRRLTAFRCGDANRAVVIVGGQADGFFSLNYLEPLTVELVNNGWSVVQALFTSWYTAYGQATLENDNEDMDMLMAKLKQSGVTEVCLLGHHTGAQDVLSYVQAGQYAKMVSRVIMQGGVHDPKEKRERDFEHLDELKEEAKRLISEGRGCDMMPEERYPVPISAFRFMSLGGRHGVQDFFAPHQDPEEMAIVVGHIEVPTLLLFCLADKYCPTQHEKEELHDKIQQAMPGDLRCRWIESACDEQLNFLRGFEEEFTYEIISFLVEEDKKASNRAADLQREQEAEERRRRSVVFQAKGMNMKRSPSQVSVTSTADPPPSQP